MGVLPEIVTPDTGMYILQKNQKLCQRFNKNQKLSQCSGPSLNAIYKSLPHIGVDAQHIGIHEAIGMFLG